MKLLSAIVTGLFALVPLTAHADDFDALEARDHDHDEYQIARDAYALADAGEGTYNDLRRYYPQVAYAANDVHMRASDLYHAASSRDHDLLGYFYRVEDAYRRFLDVLRYSGACHDPYVDRDARWMESTFYQLARKFRLDE